MSGAGRPVAAGSGCLSQWWPSPFVVDDVRFATAEHYMMWRKAKLFGDDEVAAQVVAAVPPKRAKDLGRRVRRFDEATWVGARREIVVDGNVAKFTQHPDLYLAADDPRTGNPRGWRGLNLLGFALADVRAQLGSRTGSPAAR
ncbi:NADAR family protein [Amycolatopsis sp. NBC_01307]|uniref:NADAR family protein n=1 Tax=Amycolatopsis sp. NBC_01307 TaxID=2903561 RepID=UPI002E12AA74